MPAILIGRDKNTNGRMASPALQMLKIDGVYVYAEAAEQISVHVNSNGVTVLTGNDAIIPADELTE